MEVFLMQGQSLCIVLLITLGIFLRKKRTYHVRIMSTAIIWDILLILQIELSRSAVLKASKALENTMLLNIHVAIAVTTVVLYGFMIKTGLSLLKGKSKMNSKHKLLGWLTISMRILTFITSFWAVSPGVSHG
jgi:hypothetical protein